MGVSCRSIMKMAAASIAVCALTWAAPALAAPQNGWVESGGERYWYDDGVMARDKQVYDPASDAWYWFDADGTMATDKDVFVPVSNEDRSRGKWVRYDADGHMVKGEDCRYGGWYYFDPVTGEMAKGFRFVDSNGGKWVFYDYTTGQMAHGERYIDGSHGDEPGWMYFDDSTGAVLYGWRFLMSDVDFKWVYYDTSTGRMVHGSRVIDGVPREFDMATGAHLFGGRYSPDEAREVLDLVNQARAAVGVAPLEWDDELGAVAEVRAAELTILFSHTRPDGSPCMAIFPPMQAGGENIAAGQRSAVEVNEDWTNSPGHYANMINPAYTKLGVGCLIDDNGYKYWVEVFTS
ncbi:hypothetical protein H6A18_07705 [Collinsella tanakaei]|nr:hypothetical protein [Collinsella tanakaei]